MSKRSSRTSGSTSSDDEEGLDIDMVAQQSMQKQDSGSVMITDDDDDLENDGPVNKNKGPLRDQTSMNIDSDSDEEEEDEIVQRYEVFLSHSLTKNLYVFQFPLRPTSRPYEFRRLREAKFKPNHKKMDLEFEINRNS